MESKSFEERLNRLGEIVGELEGKALPLDESLKLFEEGKKLCESLSKELEEAKLKVEEVTGDVKVETK
ncbi:MAG TPA: exodeoxyribonuclease VII small subunit [Candidatus Enteromonas pullicola]|uniref:Exodeoxyribonuclease 7 small subunit n=1 Tax=Candidatus Alloenteromonas pullicola TaxID=2840784 RepID=A0A9D1LPD7_9FIRM|nr:exodeoxyribonuclease VII small subunit [Candidatus Enteromonas pullicola]